MSKFTTTTLSIALLGFLTACGGGGGSSAGSPTTTTPPSNNNPAPPTYANKLTYQNPTSTGYRLVQDVEESTPTNLVLDLVGPSGTQAMGVAFFLTADATKVAWSSPTGDAGVLLQPGEVFPLGTAPQMLTSKASSGQLQVGIFQKGGAGTIMGAAPLLSVSLGLDGTTVPAGAVALALQSGKQAVALGADQTLAPITIDIGTLTAE